MDDIYEVKIGADISPFQKAIQSVTNLFTSFGNAVERRQFKLQLEDTIRDIRLQIQYLESEYFRLQAIINNGNATDKQKRAYDVLGVKIKDYYRSLTEAVNEYEKLGDVTEDSGEKQVNLFKDLWGTVKKYGLALIGVRSTFMIFRRAMNSALSNNIELSNKFQAVWVTLGNALTPILERIVNLILKAFSYLNVFIKAVSGGKIDLLANTAKGAKSTAGSLKEANKQLAGFDELNNIDDTSGGGAGVDNLGFADAFKDIDLDTKWMDRIEQFGEWCKVNWPIITGAVMGAFLAFSKLGDGLVFIEKLGIILVFAGLFEIIKGISDFIEGVFNGDLVKVAQGFGEILVGIGLVIAGFNLLTGTFTVGIGLLVAGIVALGVFIIQHKEEIVQKLKEAFESVKAGFAEGKENIKNMLSRIGGFFKEKIERIKAWWVGMKDTVVSAISTMAEKIKEKLNYIKDNWKTILGNGIVALAEGMVNSFIKGVNYIIRALNKINFSVPDWVPVIGGKSFGFHLTEHELISLPRLDSGTNYVPSDTLAMIHKGEAVIPKKFNAPEYFNYDETNELLQTLIDRVDNLDINPYITVKDVGEASVKYQNQQYRLRGRALVNG